MAKAMTKHQDKISHVAVEIVTAPVWEVKIGQSGGRTDVQRFIDDHEVAEYLEERLSPLFDDEGRLLEFVSNHISKAHNTHVGVSQDQMQFNFEEEHDEV